MLYTLALFATEPIKWVERFDWRKFSDLERCAMGTFFKSMGDAMLIDYGNLPSAKRGFQDGIQWLEEIGQWSEKYEIKHMVPHKDNHQLANETTAILLFTLPDALRSVGMQAVTALMDDRLRIAMMFVTTAGVSISLLMVIRYPRPLAIYSRVVNSILSLRKWFLKHIALPRSSLLRYRFLDDKLDDHGRRGATRYEAEPFYVRPTLWNRWGPSAFVSRLLGLPLPGDSGDTYFPKGYSIREVGPSMFVSKGVAEAEETKARLRRERTGGCPFAVSR
jgi:hypothetical protein